jgi:hypothetical protein
MRRRGRPTNIAFGLGPAPCLLSTIVAACAALKAAASGLVRLPVFAPRCGVARLVVLTCGSVRVRRAVVQSWRLCRGEALVIARADVVCV